MYTGGHKKQENRKADRADRRLVEEMADLWFHTLVLLGERGIPLRDVLKELSRRHPERHGG